MSGIFVSYRRASSSAVVYRLVDELKERFGDEAIFFDVESIDPGMSFAQAIQQALAKSTIALIVIGPTWAHVTDEAGNRRLENPDDWVRHEVYAALNSRARVIPLLVEGAEIPPSGQLPSNIQELSSLQAFTINKSPEYWDFDVKRLEERLRKIDRNLPRPPGGDLPHPPPQPPTGHFSKKVIWGCSLVVMFGLYMLSIESGTEQQNVSDIAEQMYGLVFFFGLAFALNWMGLSDINKGFTKGKGFAIGGMTLSGLLFVIAAGMGALLEMASEFKQEFGNSGASQGDQQQQQAAALPEPGNETPVVAAEQQVTNVQTSPVKPRAEPEEEDDSDYQPASAPNIAGTWSSNIGASYQFGNNLNGTVFFYEFNALQVQVGYGEGAYEDGLFRFQYTNTLFQTGAPLELQLSGSNTLRGTLYNPITGQPASSIEMYKVSAGY